MIIETNIEQLRDPFMVATRDAYYMYGTGWQCYKNTTKDLENGWVKIEKEIVKVPENFVDCDWAPEVHRYNGAYYMFTTYLSSKNNHRGCSIFKSDSPEGPFVEISDGHITPKDWDAIDGTFYVDEEGTSWMVFVHEWTSTEDSVGRMAAVKLSKDLTKAVSEPVELFRADSPSWTNLRVTDGCFMYKTKDGNLLMIWSNNIKNPDNTNQYVVGIAKSDNGKVDGKWSHFDELLYEKKLGFNYDGGHGMIIDVENKKFLLLHSPNKPQNNRKEKPVFIETEEKNGKIVCK